jgi:hypothetical protein
MRKGEGRFCLAFLLFAIVESFSIRVSGRGHWVWSNRERIKVIESKLQTRNVVLCECTNGSEIEQQMTLGVNKWQGSWYVPAYSSLQFY